MANWKYRQKGDQDGLVIQVGGGGGKQNYNLPIMKGMDFFLE